ncbi:hypothetical protein ON010_g6558 [Phytophthora cinnamomi]|nr:hypothetical protein ON010_g6558 [Phytophthora cinnamomi]
MRGQRSRNQQGGSGRSTSEAVTTGSNEAQASAPRFIGARTDEVGAVVAKVIGAENDGAAAEDAGDAEPGEAEAARDSSFGAPARVVVTLGVGEADDGPRGTMTSMGGRRLRGVHNAVNSIP